MRKLTFILLLLASALTTFGQDGHVIYTDVSNSKHFGRDVLVRSDAANLDTLTSVYDGSIAFDTSTNHAVVYDDSQWNEISYGRVRDTSITIATAAVLTLNSSPVTIVSAQGAGTVIEVISASAKLTYNSVQYATNTILQLFTSGGDDAQSEWDATFLQTNSSVIARSVDVSDKSNLVENADLQVTVETGDPTTGDSDIKIYLRYRIIEL